MTSVCIHFFNAARFFPLAFPSFFFFSPAALSARSATVLPTEPTEPTDMASNGVARVEVGELDSEKLGDERPTDSAGLASSRTSPFSALSPPLTSRRPPPLDERLRSSPSRSPPPPPAEEDVDGRFEVGTAAAELSDGHASSLSPPSVSNAGGPDW